MSIHYRPHTDRKSSHQQIAAAVRELAGERGFAPVLDVGAAQGMLGQMLAGSGIEIDAVEMNPRWAELAKPHYREVFNSAIETAPLESKQYRLIVCGDVLEHLVDPVATIAQLRRAATDDVRFIISLPNVAHIAVRTMLLFGKFPQMDRGILDRTHLHFYTRKTAIGMLDRAGLKVERASATGMPIDELWKNGQGNLIFKCLVKLQHLALAIFPRLFGYQWIFIATVKSAAKSTAKSA